MCLIHFNGEFKKLWLKDAQKMPETVGRKEYLEMRGYMEFYGTVNSRLNRKCEWAIETMGRYIEVAKGKNEKEMSKWAEETRKGLARIGVTEAGTPKKSNVMIGDALMPLDETVMDYLNVVLSKIEEKLAAAGKAGREKRNA